MEMRKSLEVRSKGERGFNIEQEICFVEENIRMQAGKAKNENDEKSESQDWEKGASGRLQ